LAVAAMFDCATLHEQYLKVGKPAQRWPVRRQASANGQVVAVRLESRDIAAWCNDPFPVILIVYDASEERAYWLHVQSYFANRRRPRRGTGATTTVYLPRDRILDEAAIRQFAAIRDRVMARLRGGISYEG
jgi:hypothetical protein